MQPKLTTMLMFTVGLCMAGAASAKMTTFDFEDGIHQVSSTELSGLDAYLQSTFGSPYVDAGDARWFGSSNTFGSDAIFSSGYSSRLDFDTLPKAASNFKITAISFDWGVFDATLGRDFGLDVFDDTINRYRLNVFEVFDARDGDTGSSGLIKFDSAWEVTRLRFHDSGTYDVGMDNLTIYDNYVAVPEPRTLGLFGAGLLSLGLVRRKRAAWVASPNPST